MQGITRRQVVPSITLGEHERQKAAGEYPRPAAAIEVEVKLTQGDAARLLRLLETWNPGASEPLTTFELALRIAVSKIAD